MADKIINLRIPHIGEQIFANLSFEDLIKCLMVSPTWHHFAKKALPKVKSQITPWCKTLDCANAFEIPGSRAQVCKKIRYFFPTLLAVLETFLLSRLDFTHFTRISSFQKVLVILPNLFSHYSL